MAASPSSIVLFLRWWDYLEKPYVLRDTFSTASRTHSWKMQQLQLQKLLYDTADADTYLRFMLLYFQAAVGISQHQYNFISGIYVKKFETLFYFKLCSSFAS